MLAFPIALVSRRREVTTIRRRPSIPLFLKGRLKKENQAGRKTHEAKGTENREGGEIMERRYKTLSGGASDTFLCLPKM